MLRRRDGDLGVPYWDVVMRGFGLALTYYISRFLAVYLICVRLLPRDPIAAPAVSTYEQVKTSIFFRAVVFLLAKLPAGRCCWRRSGS
jgi:TRAP-type uncharacterized transport system fused permease subunit